MRRVHIGAAAAAKLGFQRVAIAAPAAETGDGTHGAFSLAALTKAAGSGCLNDASVAPEGVLGQSVRSEGVTRDVIMVAGQFRPFVSVSLSVL